ncbi:hypothetical protein EDI_097860 [Entamoeba dispar SAW760]|uniref:Uncharacterized protein n=1 Tax=Entamoeba dispar (strain ATCC PRA-260 / SAW760) TaxID=370354 RepID=B0EJT6_ENTDS|nr:uncharacterized protein EDI_097860 [Entamoeba dispar SAW760]EDR25204.1 hypothetical protein EDI_097860 [Entamoeba dispar SAW760]|eukprot:EDR25204.1 hypothetical protein EDI_097860 [Entamoeba dispar SAW760]
MKSQKTSITTDLKKSIINFYYNCINQKIVVTPSLIECFIEENFKKIIKIDTNIIQQLQMKFISIKLNQPIKDSKLKIKINQLKNEIDHEMKIYGKELTFFIDEVGIQIQLYQRSINSLLKNNEKQSLNLILDRRNKVSCNVLCVNGMGEYITSFNQTERLKTKNYFTNKEFKTWFIENLMIHIERRKQLLNSTDKEILIITIKFYFLDEEMMNDCNKATIKINQSIKELEQINNKTNESIDINVYNILNHIKLISQTKVQNNKSVQIEKEQQDLIYSQKKNMVYYMLLNKLSKINNQKKSITLNTLTFELNEQYTIQINKQNLLSLLNKFGFKQQKTIKLPLKMELNKEKIIKMVQRLHKYNSIDASWIFTFDTYDFRLFVGNQEESIIHKDTDKNIELYVGRETRNSTIALCVSGSGYCFPPLCCTQTEQMSKELEKQFHGVHQEIGSNFITKSSIVNYLKNVFVPTVQQLKEYKKYKGPSILILPHFFKKIIQDQILFSLFNEKEIFIEFINDHLWYYTPLERIFRNITNDIIIKDINLCKTEIRTTVLGKKKLLLYVIDRLYNRDIISREFFNSRFIYGFNYLSIENVELELSYILNQNSTTIKINLPTNTTDDTLMNCFSLSAINPFYQDVFRLTLESNEFQKCQTKKLQNEFLIHKFGMEIIPSINYLIPHKVDVSEPQKRLLSK